MGLGLSLVVELDPCSSHQDLFGQLITKKVQHRRYLIISFMTQTKEVSFIFHNVTSTLMLKPRYSVPASYTPAWNSLHLIKEYVKIFNCAKVYPNF